MSSLVNIRAALASSVIFLSLTGFAGAQNNDEVIRVDTSIVTVPVRVFDKEGRSIAGLTKDDFRVSEDRSPQEIANFSTDNSPITVALMLDVSDSTRFKFNDIQAAAIAFLEKLRTGDTVIICPFDKALYCLYDGPARSETVPKIIRGIRSGGGTSLYQSLRTVSLENLKKYSGKTAIVLLTDGIDIDSKQDAGASLREMRESDAAVYVIQYETDIGADNTNPNSIASGSLKIVTPKGEPITVAFEKATRYLKELSSNSGGRFYSADTLTNLTRHFAAIADELSQTYTLSYYPPDGKKPDKVRKIKVELISVKARLRYRTGYLPRSTK